MTIQTEPSVQPARISSLERAWVTQPFRGHLITFSLAAAGSVMALLAGVLINNVASWWEASPFLLIMVYLVLLAVQNYAVLHGWKPRIEVIIISECERCGEAEHTHATVTPEETFVATPPAAAGPERIAITDTAGLLFYKKFYKFLSGCVTTGRCTESYWVAQMGFGAGEYDQFAGWLRDAGITYSKGRGSGTKLLIPTGDMTEGNMRINNFLGFDLERTIERNTPVSVGGTRVDPPAPAL